MSIPWSLLSRLVFRKWSRVSWLPWLLRHWEVRRRLGLLGGRSETSISFQVLLSPRQVLLTTPPILHPYLRDAPPSAVHSMIQEIVDSFLPRTQVYHSYLPVTSMIRELELTNLTLAIICFEREMLFGQQQHHHRQQNLVVLINNR